MAYSSTEYTLHGKNIVHMTQGSDSLHFFYDAQNRPVIVEWNNGVTTAKYAYIQNLQGDIVGIVDSNGTEVVKYTYDAWGRVLSTTGSLASTLGTVQPFRYRGYVYDVETGLYYLRDRYYNPFLQRFVNADVLIKGNLYGYCGGNPIAFYDPNGNKKYYIGIVKKNKTNYRREPILEPETRISYVNEGTVLVLEEDEDLKKWYKTVIGDQEVYILAECIEIQSEVDPYTWTYGYKDLRRSNYCSLYVMNLQISLNNAGADLRVDGYFGEATENAVIHFQKENPMLEDEPRGVVTYLMKQLLDPWIEPSWGG
nr:peptidoglycan-binding protein [Clostridia bacterium]